jgi:hypothetical protein
VDTFVEAHRGFVRQMIAQIALTVAFTCVFQLTAIALPAAPPRLWRYMRRGK